MAKRYYLSPVVLMDDGVGMSYAPAVAALPGINYSAIMPFGPDGTPLHDWCLVIVATADHSAVRALAGVDPLPDFPLDGKVSAIQATTKSSMKFSLEKRGVSSAFIDNSDGYRDAIRGIGRTLMAAFDENKFDVADR